MVKRKSGCGLSEGLYKFFTNADPDEVPARFFCASKKEGGASGFGSFLCLGESAANVFVVEWT
jgi:hypothetical protein